MKALLIFIGVVSLCAATSLSQTTPTGFPVLEGPYLGQKPPGTTPEVFAPGVVSTAEHEFSCSFTPDGNEFYFTRSDPTLKQNVIMVTKLQDGVWTEPAVVPFVENLMSFEPLVTPDNKRLYFTWGKPIPGQPGPPMNIFYVEREGDGWSAAKNPGSPFNPAKAMLVSSTMDGTIYTTDISEGPGKERIAVSHKVDGEYKTLDRLGPPINGETQSMYPFIAPDESYLVFISRRPAEKINSVLCVSSRNRDGSWGDPRTIDLGMKAGLPFVTHDGKYLFFTGGEQGKSDIYWVSAKILFDEKPAQ
jgi:WD40-like Beta Propeller Repeat